MTGQPAAQAQALAASALEAIVVTGTRSDKPIDDAPVRTEVVSRQEVERTRARTLKEALENVPGLQLREIHGKSGDELSLQGLTSDQVLVLIDGLPISPSTGSTVDLSQYLLADIERIEVVKGATSAQYGSAAMGGVINVITRRIQPGLAAQVTVDGGSRGDQNVTGRSRSLGVRHALIGAEGGNDTVRLRVTGDVLDDQGFQLDPAAWTQQGDAVQRRQLGARLAWRPSRAMEFSLDAGTYRETAEQRYLYFVPPTTVPRRKTEDIVRDRLGGAALWAFEDGLRLQLKGVGERYDSHSQSFSNGALITDRRARQQMGHLSAQADLPAWRGQLWQFGADLHEERLTQTVNGVSELGTQGPARRTSRELYVQNDILFSEVWELVLGLRGQSDSDFGLHYAPKLALKARVSPGEDWKATLRFAYGQGYRVPNLKERHFVFDHSALGYMVMGNPDLKPETSTSWQLGGVLSWQQRLTLDMNAFHNAVRDLIQVDEDNPGSSNGVAVYTYENVARARTSGLETALQWRVGAAWMLNAAYTYTRTRDLSTGTELTRRPRGMTRLGVDWKVFERTTLAARVRHQSDELVSTGGRRSPAWATLDVSLNHVFDHGLTGFAGVRNLTGRQRDFSNPDDFGPLSGRFVYVGLSYRYGPTP
jgi:outer membrane receptor for ferrienterochelin and colicins